MLLAERTVIRCHAVAVVRVRAGLRLVDQIPHQQRVLLAGAEDQRLLFLIDLRHEDLHPLPFTSLNFQLLVEVALSIQFAGLHLAFQNHVIGRPHILIQRRLDLLHAEGR